MCFYFGRLYHALGKGAMVAEIQQSSDITYRVYDYNRKKQMEKQRELHVEDALECINLDGFKNNIFPIPAKIKRSWQTVISLLPIY